MIEKQTAPHYSWGDGCDGWRLVRTPTLSVIEERMPPGASEVRHYHRSATQFFYVLHGTLSIEVDEREQELSPGQGILIPAGQAHPVLNRSEEAAEFLVVSNPPSQDDRVPAEPLP
ncbi:MAG: cupin domain-containing protein [Bryobacteraceae bacterium]|jgi:quercetin dioxygenase-like cupin family protein